MQEIKIAVQGNKAALLGNIDLVAGTIGLVCKFYFDDSWNGLNKTISYKAGSNILASKEIKRIQGELKRLTTETDGVGKASNGVF